MKSPLGFSGQKLDGQPWSNIKSRSSLNLSPSSLTVIFRIVYKNTRAILDTETLAMVNGDTDDFFRLLSSFDRTEKHNFGSSLHHLFIRDVCISSVILRGWQQRSSIPWTRQKQNLTLQASSCSGWCGIATTFLRWKCSPTFRILLLRRFENVQNSGLGKHELRVSLLALRSQTELSLDESKWSAVTYSPSTVPLFSRSTNCCCRSTAYFWGPALKRDLGRISLQPHPYILLPHHYFLWTLRGLIPNSLDFTFGASGCNGYFMVWLQKKSSDRLLVMSSRQKNLQSTLL